jgi:RNA polymerase sigma factor (sigma-70 family)
VAPQDVAAQGLFPTTHASAVLRVRDGDPVAQSRAFGTLALAYHRPIYKYLRMRFGKGPEEAADLTQDFFATAYEKRYFQTYEPERSKFRTFLKMCVDRFAAKQHAADRRLKRGGDALVVSFDFSAPEGELADAAPLGPDQLDAYFDAEWVRSLLAMAVDALEVECRARGKETSYRLFERLTQADGADEKPSYAELATELGLSLSDVKNHLVFARREFKRIVLEKLREITATEEEFRDEARMVLGIDP